MLKEVKVQVGDEFIRGALYKGELLIKIEQFNEILGDKQKRFDIELCNRSKQVYAGWFYVVLSIVFFC